MKIFTIFFVKILIFGLNCQFFLNKISKKNDIKFSIGSKYCTEKYCTGKIILHTNENDYNIRLKIPSFIRRAVELICSLMNYDTFYNFIYDCNNGLFIYSIIFFIFFYFKLFIIYF